MWFWMLRIDQKLSALREGLCFEKLLGEESCWFLQLAVLRLDGHQDRFNTLSQSLRGDVTFL